jgi:hypothetical protein
MPKTKKRDPTELLAERVFKWYRKYSYLIPRQAKWKVSGELIQLLGSSLPKIAKPKIAKPIAGVSRGGTWRGNA